MKIRVQQKDNSIELQNIDCTHCVCANIEIINILKQEFTDPPQNYQHKSYAKNLTSKMKNLHKLCGKSEGYHTTREHFLQEVCTH